MIIREFGLKEARHNAEECGLVTFALQLLLRELTYSSMSTRSLLIIACHRSPRLHLSMSHGMPSTSKHRVKGG